MEAELRRRDPESVGPLMGTLTGLCAASEPWVRGAAGAPEASGADDGEEKTRALLVDV